MSVGWVAQKGLMSWPRAPPKGLASEARAVAETRPRDVNHRSLYLVGVLRTNG